MQMHNAAEPAPSLPADTAWRNALLAVTGGVVGLLSGLTGVGGGVFLTPVLLALRAAPVKTIAAVSAAFILVNSLAGLAGGRDSCCRKRLRRATP
jgi:uncharacterized membrane protein YfcA